MLSTSVVELLAPLPTGTRVTVVEDDKLIHGVIADGAGLGLSLSEVAVVFDTAPRGPWVYARYKVEPVTLPNIVEWAVRS